MFHWWEKSSGVIDRVKMSAVYMSVCLYTFYHCTFCRIALLQCNFYSCVTMWCTVPSIVNDNVFNCIQYLIVGRDRSCRLWCWHFTSCVSWNWKKCHYCSTEYCNWKLWWCCRYFVSIHKSRYICIIIYGMYFYYCTPFIYFKNVQ